MGGLIQGASPPSGVMEGVISPSGRARPRLSVKERWRKRFLKLGGRVLWGLERLIVRCSLVEDSAFLDPAQFSWTERLESNWQAIRKEAETVLGFRERLPNFQDISPDQYSITRDDHWKTYFLYGFGEKSERNCARCPVTAGVLSSLAGLKTAFISILGPGKHLPPHRGLYKGLIRCHLALMIPEPADSCRIRVGDRTVSWKEGGCLVFDDTYEHEVWNDSSEDRVVLFLDFVRPLASPVKWLNELVIALVKWSPYGRTARRNEVLWEKRFHRLG